MTKQDISTARVGIVGGTGYTAMELLRLLLPHPKVSVHCVTSRTEVGVPVADYFPNLRGLTDLKFSPPEGEALNECQVVFFSTPHGIAMKGASALLSKGIKVIDLSADFRLTDAQVWKRWYGMDHSAPELLKVAVYGLAELHRKKISQAKLVANPGCYPTATLLGLLPLLRSGAVALDSLIVDAKSGVTGAGRKAEIDLLLTETADSFKAYAVTGHRHHPEILEQLTNCVADTAPAIAKKVALTFVPHLLPMIRGMHITLYGRILKHMDFQELYESFYAREPFVDVMPHGSYPTTRSVRASNLCRLAVHRPGDGDTLVVLSVIDNLTKGASGQAVQNMNLMMGWPETLGLMAPPVTP